MKRKNIFQALDNIIGNSPYWHVTTNQWSQQAVETITTNLVKLNKPYKYIGEYFYRLTASNSSLHISSTSLLTTRLLAWSDLWEIFNYVSYLYIFVHRC